MDFFESAEFKKEFKKLAKKYPSLYDDLETLKKTIAASPTGSGSKHWNILKHDGDSKFIMKMRMMCRSVKGSQFRVIYSYDGKQVGVVFIEVYFKGNKELEDRMRVEKYFAEMSETK